MNDDEIIDELAAEVAADSIPGEEEPFTEWGSAALRQRIRTNARIALFKLLLHKSDEKIRLQLQNVVFESQPIFNRAIEEGEFEE